MTYNLENCEHIFKGGGDIEARYSAFRQIVVDYGLSSFVAFVMHKNFEHTNLEKLDDESKTILIDECEPLIREAVEQGNSLQ